MVITSRKIMQSLSVAINKIIPCTEAGTFYRKFVELILFKIGENTITLIASNGNTMGFTKLEIPHRLPQGDWTINRKIARKLAREIRQSVKVKMGIDRKKLIIQTTPEDGRFALFALYKEPYPNYHHPFSNLKGLNGRVVFKAKDTKRVLSGIKKKKFQTIKILFRRNQRSITAVLIGTKDDTGETQKHYIPATTHGTAKIPLLPKNFSRAVRVLGGEITLEVFGGNSIALFKSKGVNWIIMPLRI